MAQESISKRINNIIDNLILANNNNDFINKLNEKMKENDNSNAILKTNL
jgi:hypothetical protein